MKTLLLFDMDGVLLTPGGYHKALQHTVAYLGRCLGFEGVILSQDQIHAFEAAGITNEWDSAAICLAVMAAARRLTDPEIEIGLHLLTQPLRLDGSPAPDFNVMLTRMAKETDREEHPFERAKTLLPAQVHWIVQQAYKIDGLSQRVQQEYVLGSEVFGRTYGLAGLLDVPSYLVKYDRSNLDAIDRGRLMAWLARASNGAVVFTNRPTLGPDSTVGTPEGELGVSKLGLGQLPLAGSGGITWLEDRFGLLPGTYNKPHPLHALAALRMALGNAQEDALLAARQLIGGAGVDAGWSRLSGVEAWVFEDATAGIKSLRIAKDILQDIGIDLRIRLVGVAENPAKQQALQESGAEVFPVLSEALKRFFESQDL